MPETPTARDRNQPGPSAVQDDDYVPLGGMTEAFAEALFRALVERTGRVDTPDFTRWTQRAVNEDDIAAVVKKVLSGYRLEALDA